MSNSSNNREEIVQGTKEKILFFDLDGTLYAAGGGYEHHTRKNLFKFMHDKGFASSVEEAELTWRPLFQQYNQSYKALISGGYSFDREEYWRTFRAGANLFMSADSGLAEFLSLLPHHKKVIFTNCRENEAIELLDVLGVRHMFSAIYGADFMGDCCKPEKESFLKVFEHMNITEEHQLYFFEDSVKNLKMGHELGMTTILIDGVTAREEKAEVGDTSANVLQKGEAKQREHFIDVIVPTLNDGGRALRSVLPEIFPN